MMSYDAPPGIEIWPLFRDLFPPLTNEEYATLKQSIQAHGITNPVVFWSLPESYPGYEGRDTNVLVDGHNRIRIAKELGIYEEGDLPNNCIAFTNLEQAMQWVISNQVGRRNLNAAQKAALALKHKQVIEEEAAKRMKSGKKIDPSENLRQGFGRSSDIAAAAVGISGRTLEKAEKIYDEAEPELIAAVMSGKVSIDAGHKLTEQPPEVQKQVAAAPTKAEAKQAMKEVFKRDTVAMDRASDAVAALNRIPVNDRMRDDALRYVVEWCNNHIEI
jgi:ParB-like chromosome segregation protein Spo0J